MEICRACLVSAEQTMIPLDETIVLGYNLLTNLNVSLHDGMPQNLCPNCAQVVKSFIEFRENAIISETTLREVKQDNKSKDDLQPGNKIELCIKQEVKIENDSYSFDSFFDESIDYTLEEIEPEFSIKIKKEPDKTKQKTKCQSKKKITKKAKKIPNKKVIKPKKQLQTSVGTILSCGICKNKFEDVNQLKSHLQMHVKYRECEICHERFSSWPGLLSHRLEHIPEKQGYCHLCNKRFITSIYLEYHYITTHNDGQQIALKCKICQKTCRSPRKLKNHMSFLHAGARFFCDYCSKGFTCKSNLCGHIQSHSDLKSNVCDLCGFQCNRKQNLKAHMLRKHTPNKVICKSCTAAFADQKKHDSHKCRVKPITCPHCGKMVSSKTIGRHMRSHKAASYKCTRCPATYKTRAALRVHVDRHDGVRRLACDFCPAKFFSHPVLIKHRRIHTGEKPYVCNICNKGFTAGNNLKVHMKVHGIFSIVKKDNSAENISEIFKKHSV